MPDSPDFSDDRQLEKYSSTFTLSDMEIFIFPELFFPLVLSNIMSPIIWKWRDDPWFLDISKKSFTYKVNRIKQYIIEHFIFNLDLETWGLTSKDVEMERFSNYIDINVLKQSNALFGYEGDKYYFDLDIRRHFGLDKYTTDVIPYWKTETIEAMTAFRYKPGFTFGAGECVSLSALYAAALFIVGRIPLENIYLISTPLHSQNFIDIDDGVITNNRRILTKNMWYNGSVLSDKGRRALENEKVTIVSHISGYIHHIYKRATILPQVFDNFTTKLTKYLRTDLSFPVLINYLRFNSNFQKFFQHKQIIGGHAYYIEMEKIYEFEHKFHRSFSDQNTKPLFDEVPLQEFSVGTFKERIVLQEVESFFAKHKTVSNAAFRVRLTELATQANCKDLILFEKCLSELFAFIHTKPKLPSGEKQFISCEILAFNPDQSREEILAYIYDNARKNEVAQLALYTYRDMERINWRPFIKAALERNPVSISGLKGKSIAEAAHFINQFPNDSIYDSTRLALPDEVWNFQHGDGIEKAILLANYIYSTDKEWSINLNIDKNKVILEHREDRYVFMSTKGITKKINLFHIFQESCCKCY